MVNDNLTASNITDSTALTNCTRTVTAVLSGSVTELVNYNWY